MATRLDRRVDASIAAAPEYAKPILRHLRALVHKAVPQAEETLKWGRPAFIHHGTLCGMAAFREHCVFGFWNAEMHAPGQRNPFDSFGRIRRLEDLPSDRELLALIRRAARLNAAGQVRSPMSGRSRKPRRALPVPADLRVALARNARAGKAFAALSPSHRREYIEWIAEAKREETRARRVETTLAWVAQGKSRNWKYQK
jgi:hypothetical protein